MPRWRPRSCGVNTSMIVLSHRRILYCPDGGMADAHASGACILTDVEVRVLFWAPFDSQFVCELLAHGKPCIKFTYSSSLTALIMSVSPTILSAVFMNINSKLPVCILRKFL